MASGTINGSTTYQKSYMSFGVNWSSVSNGAVANTSTLTINTWWQTTNTNKKWDTVGQRTGNYVNIYVNGTLVVNDTWNARFNCDPWSANPYIIRTTTYTVQHNNDGTPPTIEIEAYANGTASSGGTQYGPGPSSVNRTSITIDNIPRYPNVSLVESTKSYGWISFNWFTDVNCDYLWYSTDNGTTWVDGGAVSGTSGYVKITGLNPETTYGIKSRLRRSDNQLIGESNAINITTAQRPRVLGTTIITIGDTLTMDISNPLNDNITIEIRNTNDILFDTITTNTNGTYTYNTTSIKNDLYNSIPNARYGTFKYITNVVNEGITYTYTKIGNNYNIDVADSTPSITSVVYEDTNNDTLAITSDNQKLISNNSITTINATGLVVKNSATISSVVLKQKGTTIQANMVVSGTSASATGLILPYLNLSSKDIEITLTDSRGLTNVYTLTTDLLQYSNPTATYSIKRESNYYSNTTFLVNANYTQIGSNTLTIRTRQKQEGTSTWGNYTTLTNGTASTISLDNTYYWDVEVEVSDSLHTTTYTTKVARGMPLIYFDTTKNSLGINCFPNNSKSLEIDNDIYLIDDLNVGGDVAIGGSLVATNSITTSGNATIGGNVYASNIYDNNYSTSEVRIGTFMNKPLYRKVIPLSDLTPYPSTVKTEAHGIANIDKVVNIYGIAYWTYLNQFFNITNYTWQQSGNWSSLHLQADTTNIYVSYNGSNYLQNVSNVYITLEYTKTTD